MILPGGTDIRARLQISPHLSNHFCGDRCGQCEQWTDSVRERMIFSHQTPSSRSRTRRCRQTQACRRLLRGSVRSANCAQPPPANVGFGQNCSELQLSSTAVFDTRSINTHSPGPGRIIHHGTVARLQLPRQIWQTTGAARRRRITIHRVPRWGDGILKGSPQMQPQRVSS